MIHAAEQTNYDGDPEYYQQIKALALQAGIPIKSFKTNPFRLAKTGLLSALDMAAFGLLPNSLYEPQNEAEQMAASIGGIGGALLPWGLPMRTLQAGKALLGGQKWLQSGVGKKAWDAFLRRSPKSGAGKDMYKQPAAPGGNVPIGAKINNTNQPVLVAPQGGTPIKIMPGQPIPVGSKPIPTPSNIQDMPNFNPGGGGKPTAKPWQPDTRMPDGSPMPTAANVMPQGAGGAPKISPKVKVSDKLRNEANTARTTNQTGGAPKQTGGKPKGGAAQGPKDASFSFKMNKSGVPSKGELAKIKAKMTQAEKASYKRMKGKAKTAFLQQWAKTHGYKIVNV